MIFALAIPAILCSAAIPSSISIIVEHVRFLWIIAWIALLLVLLLSRTIRRRELHFRSDPVLMTLLMMLCAALAGTLTGVNMHEAARPLMILAVVTALYGCLIQGQVTTSSVVDVVIPGIAAAGIVAVVMRRILSDDPSAGDTPFATLLLPVVIAATIGLRNRLAAMVAAVAVALLAGDIVAEGRGTSLPALFVAVVSMALSIAGRKDLFHGHGRELAMRIGVVTMAIVAPILLADTSRIARDFAEITRTSSPYWDSQRDLWTNASRMGGESWLLGVGPGNFAIRYPPANATQIADSPPDARNVYLHLFAEQGIVGLLLFLFISYASVRRYAYYLRNASDPSAAIAMSGLFASTLVFLTLGCFETLTSFVLGAAVFTASIGLTEAAGNQRMRFFRGTAGETFTAVMIVLLLCGCYFGFIAVKDALADDARERGLAAGNAGNLREAARLLEESSEWRFNDWRTQWELGRFLRLSGQDADAKARLEFSLRLNPHHARARRMLDEIRQEEGDRGERK